MDSHSCSDHEGPLYWMSACPRGQEALLGLWQCSWDAMLETILQATGSADTSGFHVKRLSAIEAARVAAGWQPDDRDENGDPWDDPGAAPSSP